MTTECKKCGLHIPALTELDCEYCDHSEIEEDGIEVFGHCETCEKLKDRYCNSCHSNHEDKAGDSHKQTCVHCGKHFQAPGKSYGENPFALCFRCYHEHGSKYL